MSDGPFRSPERLALADSVAGFTRDRIAPFVSDWETAGEMPRALQQQAAELGLLSIGFPEGVGGLGGDAVDMVVIIEQILVGACYQFGLEAAVGKAPHVSVLDFTASPNTTTAQDAFIAVDEHKRIGVRINRVRVAFT